MSAAAAAASATQGLRIQIASDLHLEFYRGSIPDDLIKPAAPVLALLGDIGLPDDPKYEQFLLQQAAQFRHVLVVLGNHEFYQARAGVPVKTCDKVKDRVRQICSLRPNLIFMDKTSLLLDGVRVLGTTLWSDIPISRAAEVGRSLNDYHLIFVDDQGLTRKLCTDDTGAWFRDEVSWIESEIQSSMAAGERNCIVLSHHTPSTRGTSDPMYDSSPIACAFSSNLTRLMRDGGTNVHTWCFGHTHYNNDFMLCGTRVVANQRGYFPSQVLTSYQPDMVVYVPADV
jgi:hypothetical protein